MLCGVVSSEKFFVNNFINTMMTPNKKSGVVVIMAIGSEEHEPR